MGVENNKRWEWDMANEWGPLEGLIGEWASEDGGLDTAYSHTRAEVLGSPYREKCSMKPFGPIDNGRQILYGLDYKSAMWRWDEENPFHTEVGYWLWDRATSEIMKGFVIPRGVSVLAGGVADAAATEFTLLATKGNTEYAIGENKYLASNASNLSYQVTITLAEGSWTYDQVTMLQMIEFDEPFVHTDRNTLSRVN